MPDNQIDISLSLLGQQSGPAFDNFVQSVAAIEKSMEAMLAHTQQLLVEANKATSESFSGGTNSSRSPKRSDDQEGSGEPSKKASRIDGLPVPRAARRALKGESGLGADAQAYVEKMDSGYASIPPIRILGNRDFSVGDRLRLSAGATGARMESTMDDLASRGGLVGRAIDNPVEAYLGAQMFARNVQAMRGWWGAHNPVTTGTALGYAADGSGAGGSLGPMRSPLAPFVNEAGRRGIEDTAHQWWRGTITPGVSHNDIKDIDGVLGELGYRNDNPARGRLEDGLVAIKQSYPGIPTAEAASMMTQATQDGTGYIEDVVSLLRKDLPDAMKISGTSLSGLMESINEVGNAAEQQGATYSKGIQFAMQYHNLTGMDPRVGQALADNSYIQARTMATTGLLPQEQALLSTGTRVAIQAQGVQEMYHMFSGFGDQQVRDKWGGVETISGKDRAIAMTAQQMGLAPDKVRRLLNDAAREEGMGTLEHMAESQNKQALGLAQKGRSPRDLRNLLAHGRIDGHDNYTSWAEMRRMLEGTKDAGGHHLFSNDQIAEIQHGIHGQVDKDIHAADKETDPAKKRELLAKAAQARYDAAKDIYTKSTQQQSRNISAQKGDNHMKVDIELKGDAAKLFKAKTYGPKDAARDAAHWGGKAITDAANVFFPEIHEGEAAVSAIKHLIG